MNDIRKGFKEYIDKNYSHLSHHGSICGNALFIYKHDIGMPVDELMHKPDGIDRCRVLLKSVLKNGIEKIPNPIPIHIFIVLSY